MVEEDPCEDLDEHDKQVVMVCWAGAVLAIIAAFVSAVHANYLWPICLPIAYGLVQCAKKLREISRAGDGGDG